jgi:hypothetical protein
MRRRLHLLLWTGGTCIGIAAPRVSAQSAAGPPALVAVSGACPESTAVQSVLSTLLPAGISARSTATASVSDLGDAYLVAVGARLKKYPDSARDCAERARVAAAFIALALALDAEPAASTKKTTDSPPIRSPAVARPPGAPPLSSVPSRTWWRLAAQGALEVAPRDGLAAPGASLRFAAGGNVWGVHAVCGWFSGASMSLPGERGSVLLGRFPCAAGPTLRFLLGTDRLEINLDAGVALGAVQAGGRGFATNYDSARLELGARVGANAALYFSPRRTGFAPIVGLEATYYPMVYQLDVAHGDQPNALPRGVVAHTPSVWVGVTAGLCWSME